MHPSSKAPQFLPPPVPNPLFNDFHARLLEFCSSPPVAPKPSLCSSLSITFHFHKTPLSLSLSLSEHSSFNYCFETKVIIIVGGSSGFKLRRDFDATTTTTTPPRMHANSPPYASTHARKEARKQEQDPQHTLSP